MADRGFIVILNDKKIPSSIGNKASSLIKLKRLKVDVPKAYVCTWEAYHYYLNHDSNLLNSLRNEIKLKLDLNKQYAVRSSANIEDSIDRSFAGQFKTVLNVKGVEQIIEAIVSIWDTANSPAIQTYLERLNMSPTQLSMAVIIQEMVQPVAAGVALSRNPVTGANEVIVEAVLGLGESLVQSGVTPFRWINKAGEWLSNSDVEEIPIQVVDQIVNQTNKIARDLKTHIDLEWAWDGKNVYWLQTREITTINHHNMYSNYIPKEMLPGMIKPLVWSINIPNVNGVFVRFLNEMLGNVVINPEDLAKSFYYRVYFNMGAIGRVFVELGLPADSVEMMTGLVSKDKIKMKPTLQMMKRLPHFLKFVHHQWKFPQRIEQKKPELDSKISSLRWQDSEEMDITELIGALDRLRPLFQEIAYYNILCPMLAVMHKRVFEKELTRSGIEPSNFDIHEGLPELAEFNPNTHLRRIHTIFTNLEPSVQDKVRVISYEEFLKLSDINEFQQEVEKFINRFGHLSDNGNDFSTTPWREDPDMVLGLIINSNLDLEEKIPKFQYKDIKLNPLRRLLINLFYQRVRTYSLLREYLSNCYTYIYGFFRNYYLAIGKHLTNKDIIDSPTDIFYLTDIEVRKLAQGINPEKNIRDEIAHHKQDIEKFRDITLPTVIYGDETPPIVDQSTEQLSGFSTSIGQHTGPVRVVRGIQDFEKVLKGDVLVIPYSDVGWTPLFARAGAIVAESGGLLSHSSIIAREYGIPAVVSVNGAMNLVDDMLVTVDGHKGLVIINKLNAINQYVE